MIPCGAYDDLHVSLASGHWPVLLAAYTAVHNVLTATPQSCKLGVLGSVRP